MTKPMAVFCMPRAKRWAVGLGLNFNSPMTCFYTLGDFFIDCGDFVQNTGDCRDRYIRPSGDISYAYFFFNHVVM